MSAPATTPDAIPLLRFLPPESRQVVLAAFTRHAFAFGQVIVREGDDADAFFYIVSGRARVVKRGEDGQEVPLNLLRAGDAFGDAGLLRQMVRTATVRASSDVQVLRLDRAVFLALLHTYPELRSQIDLEAQTQHVRDFFRAYTAFAELPAPAIQRFVASLRPVQAAAGALVIRQGDAPGPMYVIKEGRLRVFTEQDGRRHYRAYLRRGDFFGEMAVFKGLPRSASVEAVSPCELLALDAEAFEELVAAHPEFKRSIEARVAENRYRDLARVPLDFAQELLPADAEAGPQVDPGQVALDQTPAPEAGAAAVARGPFATPDGKFVKQGRRIRRFGHVRQVDEMDCGAACLAMVCRHFGLDPGMVRIRTLAATGAAGTTLAGLCGAAEELGLAARAIKASLRNVEQMPLPAIIHWDNEHWVVLYAVDARHAWLADPARSGTHRIGREELERRWSGYAALFDYAAPVGGQEARKPRERWFMPLLAPYRGPLLQAVGLALTVSALEMVMPVFTQVIVDRVVVERDVGLLHLLIAAMGGVLVLMMAAMFVQRYLLSFCALRIDAAALDLLTRRMLTLPVSYFQRRRTGDIQRRLSGLRLVRELVVNEGLSALTAGAQLLLALPLMALYSVRLALLFMATLPVHLLFARVAARRLRPLYDELEHGLGKYHSLQIDAVKGVETVKSLAAEPALREELLGQFHRTAVRQFRADFAVMSLDGAVRSLCFLSVVMFLLAGAHETMAGRLTIGGLVAFSALVALANTPIRTIQDFWERWQNMQVLLARLDDVFDSEPEQGHDRSRLVPVRSVEGRVQFRNLGFRYGGPGSAKILDDVSLDVPPGRTVAIVGRSGSGKTTLVKLLSAMILPTEGSILIDGMDLLCLNHRDLRRRIGFVLQENYLFSDTIAHNIAFGEREPDMDRVLWAARVASADDFVERLPLGYDTRIGESGIQLSGGQRQRLAIARAVYHDPPILVFDEATSALDTESERAVKENMDALLKNRTSFVIAHRLSTIRDADTIVVLERGRIAEVGSHEELMDRKGLYFYLCSAQLGLG